MSTGPSVVTEIERSPLSKLQKAPESRKLRNEPVGLDTLESSLGHSPESSELSLYLKQQRLSPE